MTEQQDKLGQALGYCFRDRRLLSVALTHRSAGGNNNERLEFLGDSLLSALISVALFLRHTSVEEGALTRLRANLVNQSALAAVANEIELGEYLSLGPGELKSGGQRRSSILADALEAVLGAVYLDGGFDGVNRVVMQLFGTRLLAGGSMEALKDNKTRLQESLQANGLTVPRYHLESVTGQPHEQIFHVSCRVDTLGLCTYGAAGSRRNAEQEAAGHMLESLPDG